MMRSAALCEHRQPIRRTRTWLVIMAAIVVAVNLGQVAGRSDRMVIKLQGGILGTRLRKV
jgi:hypothetical protein